MLITIEYKKWLAVIAAIFMIRPYYIQINSTLNSIWAYGALLVSLIFFISVIKEKDYPKNCLFFCIVYIFATLLYRNNNILGAVSESAQILLAYNLIFYIKDRSEVYLMDIRKVFISYIFIDIIFGALKISTVNLGLYKQITFLGYDNYAAYSIVCMIVIIWSIDMLHYNKLTQAARLCWGGALAYKIMTDSINAIVILILLMMLYLIFMYCKKVRQFFSIQTILIVMLVVFILLYKFDLYNVIVSMITGRESYSTLNFRTVIWHKLVPCLYKIPLWGYGKVEDGIFQNIIGLSSIWDVQANHGHNLFLDIWFSSGIIGILIYLRIIYDGMKNVKLSNMNKPMMMIWLGIIVYLLMGFLDGYPYTSVSYFMFALSYYYRQYGEKNNV